jgi:hypothetical protein
MDMFHSVTESQYKSPNSKNHVNFYFVVTFRSRKEYFSSNFTDVEWNNMAEGRG